jgi:hypothetical protein
VRKERETERTSLVREPIRDGKTLFQPSSELGTGNVRGGSALRDLVLGAVSVLVDEVGHGLEGDHLDVKLVLVLGDKLLGVVATREGKRERVEVSFDSRS